MQIFVIIWSAIIFAVISSYLNVVIDRGWRQSIQPRSVCDACARKLKPLWMIPVFSALFCWIFHGSQSYCCQKKIPAAKYFYTELLGAITGVLVGNFFYNLVANSAGFDWKQLIIGLIVILPITLVFLYLAQQDIWFYAVSVPVIIVLISLVAIFGLIMPMEFLHLFGVQPLSFGAILAGLIGAVITAVLIIISRGRGLGSGDVLLVFVMGFSLGGLYLFVASQLAIYLATIFGMMYALYIRKFKGIIIPLVPFLYLGWLLAWVFRATWAVFLANLTY